MGCMVYNAGVFVLLSERIQGQPDYSFVSAGPLLPTGQNYRKGLPTAPLAHPLPVMRLSTGNSSHVPSMTHQRSAHSGGEIQIRIECLIEDSPPTTFTL